MAVLGRVLFSSAERVDLPDLLSIDSYTAGDWKAFIQGLVGSTRPYILSGFDVISPESAVGAATCSIRVADSAVYYPGSAAGPFFFGMPAGDPTSAPLVPKLHGANATNYVFLTLSTFDTASDTRALWDPDRNATGAEFTQNINTQTAIQVQVNVSTGSFPVNTVPVAIITTGSNGMIASIQDARDMLFRLGTGGLNPNPLNGYSFRSLPSSTYARFEPDTVISQIGGTNPFQGGDKNILTLKEWMDTVMTKLRELGGTKYWYEDTGTFNLATIYKDVLTGYWKSKGTYSHSTATAGVIIWSEDIHFNSVNCPRDLVIRAGTSAALADGQVAYIKLLRNQLANNLDLPVVFTNSQTYVNSLDGSVGYFANLKQGDWIRKASDQDIYFAQVLDFKANTNGGGASTTAANARSVVLSSAYTGTTSSIVGDRARYERGVYTAADLVIVDRSNSSIVNASGDFFWFAQRSDTVLKLSNATRTTLPAGNVTGAAGTCTATIVGHGLNDKDYITITSPAGAAGTFCISVNVNTLTWASSYVGGPTAMTAYYATATCTSRYDAVVGTFLLESGTNDLASGNYVTIAGCAVGGYNGTMQANPVPAAPTQFRFPVGSALAADNPANATARIPKVYVRSEDQVIKLAQGTTSVVTNNQDVTNLQNIVGITSGQSSISYTGPATGAFSDAGACDYGSVAGETFLARVSKLNSMMKDKAQDKNVLFYTEATTAVNVVNGGNRDIYFSPSSNLVIIQPGSGANATVTLPTSASKWSIPANQSAYVTINRNAGSTPGVTIAATTSVPVDENTFVLASRLGNASVVLWNGQVVTDTTPMSGVNFTTADSNNLAIATGLTRGTAFAPGAITIGGSTTDTSISIGRGGVTTTFNGPVSAGNVTLIGTLTLTTIQPQADGYINVGNLTYSPGVPSQTLLAGAGTGTRGTVGSAPIQFKNIGDRDTLGVGYISEWNTMKSVGGSMNLRVAAVDTYGSFITAKDYTYASTRAGYVTLSSWEFNTWGTTVATDLTTVGDTEFSYFTYSGAGQPRFMAHVMVPAGATLTSVSVRHKSGPGGSTGNCIVYTQDEGGTRTRAGSVNALNTGYGSPQWETFNISPNVLVADNSSVIVQLMLSPNGTGGSNYIYAVKLNYTYDALAVAR